MVDLSPYTTLRVPAQADRLVEITSTRELSTEIEKGTFKSPFFILGRGANVLFKSDFPGVIVVNRLSGRKTISETDTDLTLEIAGGEGWPEFVAWAVQNRLAGVENLADIPGTIGSAPYQNIAAYGQALSDVLVSLKAVNLATGKLTSFSAADCQLRYRSSIFQTELKNQYFITSATLKLAKIANHVDTSYHSRYESLSAELAKFATPPYSISDIYQAVVNLRAVKLPDWTTTGTAGSFFKNPIVTKSELQKLQSRISELQFYPTTHMDYPPENDPSLTAADYVKIPAGRLLDELGWKGKTIGRVGTFSKHALVIVTSPGATGQEVWEFSESMRADVSKNYGLNLEYEVVIV